MLFLIESGDRSARIVAHGVSREDLSSRFMDEVERLLSCSYIEVDMEKWTEVWYRSELLADKVADLNGRMLSGTNGFLFRYVGGSLISFSVQEYGL